ncbi:GroES-like protein, partial [Aureobasidium melanogenum]
MLSLRTWTLDLVNELLARDLARSHFIHTAKDTLETAAAKLLGVSLDLALSEQLLSKLPEHLAELEVLGLSRDGVASESEGLANDGGEVEGGVSAQRLDEVVVVRRADSDDLETRQLGVLDGEGTSGGRSTVDEDGEGLLSRLGGKGKLQALVKTWIESSDTNTESGSILGRQRVGDLHRNITLGKCILGKAAVLLVGRVDTVGEASNAVALRELLLYC